ncbi:MAG: DNA-3-methyladenine glycosylase family protein, partial [Thermoanaerobaculia bacterium]
MKLTLPGMDLGLVVRSHGWYDLPPFEWQPAEKTLGFIFLERGFPVRVVIEERASGLAVTATPLPPSDSAYAAAAVQPPIAGNLRPDGGSHGRAARAAKRSKTL